MSRIYLLIIFAISICVFCQTAFAEEVPKLSIEISTGTSNVITDETVFVTVTIKNIGTTNVTHWNRIGFPEFRFRMTDSEGKDFDWMIMGETAEPIIAKPIKPGEKVTYTNVQFATHFFEHNLPGYIPKPGEYSVWCEYLPGRWTNPDAPVVSKSNVLTFHVESPNIVSEKHVVAGYIDLSTQPISKHAPWRFNVFLHKGKESYRLYWTRGYSSYLISANVVPDKYDIVVDKYGNTHVVYETPDGKYFYYIMRNSIERPPEDPLRGKETGLRAIDKPVPEHEVPYLKKTENNWLDVPAGYKLRVKLMDGTATIEYVPAPPPAGGENHQPPGGGEDHHNGAGEGVAGETPPAAQSFPIHLIIIAAVIIIGGLAAFLIIRSQKRHGT